MLHVSGFRRIKRKKDLPMILTFMKTIFKNPIIIKLYTFTDKNSDDEAVVYGITTKSGENGVL
jgi:hypothetical protein